IRRQKINDWEKKMRIPGARVQDVAELEKILKRPITLLDITHGTIFNSKKYRSGKYEEIEMVVHNGHTFPRNHHFPKDRMVEYYKDDTWEAINNALQGPQAIWLMGVGDENQRVSQFVLEDGRAFRTWIKHTDIIKACKELFKDAVNWQFHENIINEEKKSILLKSLKVVDLAEQVFGANHAGSRLANEINEWRPISGKINDVIRQACVEHGHGGRWNAPSYHINNVVCIDMKECYSASMRGQGECAPWFNRFGHPTHHLVRVAVNGKLPKDDTTGFAQIKSFKFASNIHPVISVWYGKHFACRSGDGCVKSKGWTPIVFLRYLLETGILESVTIGEAIISLTKQTKVWLPKNRNISCAIIGKFIQGGKIDEKQLTHRLVTDEGELNFLVKDCTDAGTFAGREKCPLGFILTYYEGHQPQYTHLRASMLAYAHINLLEMLRRFDPNEVVRIATDSIYVRKDALYKIENIPAFFKQVEVKSDPNLCSHYPSCAMCSDPEEFFISKLEYAKWIKEFLKTKTPLAKYNCKRHKPFICRFCFGKWFYSGASAKTHRSDSYALLHQPEEQEIREIQPGQWRDKSEKIYDIPDSIAPTIHDPITRCRNSYLNGEGGSGKTTRAIRIFKNINMIVFTHTNALAKDFREKCNVKAQIWHSFFRWNGVEEWTPEHMGEKKFPRVVIWDKVCTVPKHILKMFINYLLEHKCQVICCGDDAQPPPFFREMPHNWLREHADYYEEVLTDYQAKCPKLRELKKEMCRKNNWVQSELFCGAIPVIEKWKYLEKKWSPSDQILSALRLSRRLASQICLKLHCTKYSEIPILLIYRPKDGRKQNCLVPIPGSSEKRELVKNDIIHLPLNTLSDKFLQGMLGKEKAIDWELGYAMTIHTSQGMTLKAPQRVWVIDEHLAWDNLIYLAVGHVEYLGQLIRIEGPPLPPEIKDAKNKKAIERSLRLFISGKLVGYMDQDKKKGREFNLSVDYILVLKDSQKNKCKLCLNELLWDWDEAGNPDQWTVDRINNELGHIKGNVQLTCLECNRNHRV
ncbi:14248_t:CDS:2, partial [Racocetra fulgida]